MHLTRRDALSTLAALGSATLIASMSHAKEEEPAQSTAVGGLRVPIGRHDVVPLPFDPTKLEGLSERLLVSHHDNNYGGAVRNLNQVEEQLANVTSDTPGFVVAGLRERELTFTNSLILHELYFGNLGGDGEAAGAIRSAIADTFSSFGRFEELYRATGMSLAGGSGWAILDFNFHTGDLRIYGSGHHTQSVAAGAPLLVMDMYEHAYHIDYGSAAASYIDAFFSNVQWEEVSRRYERALRAFKALGA